LATQAVEILHELKPLTERSAWVFPGVQTNGEPMSENPVNAALRRLGYDRTMLTAHGFRGMASTMLHESGWPTDVIERQLSHCERNSVKAAYNHAEHLPARRQMNASLGRLWTASARVPKSFRCAPRSDRNAQ
jgi:integrase